ncbi:MAG: protein-L-isoaspartate O-methyltransferase [Thermoprotei archaeon]|nr:MAG: protein-L-isoaspartate O-methyltransferase [Thermoprotei archaeon]RLF00353.1 MAG: protein-L-isoaspartate O-methyltransferase [Thermoprotei archaeon]HDI75413.1 protein-L-isoaspartate(D-aspartate) O-methyltransferase [Thermoprotei archaeon]
MIDDYSVKREMLVKRLVDEGILRSKKVIQAMLKVPREEFVLPSYRSLAYVDMPLPTLKGQTISAPHMCAIMCENLEIEEGEVVLEIGTGSGYHAALCAEIVSRKGYVITLEIFPELARFAKENLKRTGYLDRVFIIVCDGSEGPPFRDSILFDKILVTAAAPKVPIPLLKRLKKGGRMLIPVGATEFYQELVLVERLGDDKYTYKSLGPCLFVKMRGKCGFKNFSGPGGI